jgi:hypothetical protein
LDAPDLPAVVQSLEPAVLQQLVRHCGLEECGEIVALATTDQLTRLFDADLWTSAPGGGEERFDEDRFVVWLEVLSEVGTAVAARKVAEMDFDFVSAAVSRYVLVLDADATMEAQGTIEEIEDMADVLGEGTRAALLEQFLDDRLSYDLGGYRLIARKVGAWDAVVSLLIEMEHGHPASFERLMRRCARLATEHIVDNGSLYEVLTADEQLLADAAADREQRREREGYVAPAEAAAFLMEARRPSPTRSVRSTRSSRRCRRAACSSRLALRCCSEPRTLETIAWLGSEATCYGARSVTPTPTRATPRSSRISRTS